MISFRNLVYKKYKLKGLVYSNEEGMKSGVNPFNHEDYTDIMKTEALKVALNKGKYDFIYGGSRRDEEASRSKEKVLSHRDKNNRWDPNNQSIEPWHLFNMQKK